MRNPKGFEKREVRESVSPAEKRVSEVEPLQLHLGESVVDDLFIEIRLRPVLLLGLL